MAIDPVAGHSSNESQGQEQEANYLIPEGMKGFDHPRHDMPGELYAVTYNRAFNHIYMVPKLTRTMISRQLPVDRNITAA